MIPIQATIDSFFSKYPAEETHLVLDSTGPSLTKHYVALHAIGLERLDRVKQVHTFSGGTFAYFGFKSAAQNSCRHTMDEYYINLDRFMRKAHSSKFPLLGPLAHYARNKTLYRDAAPIEAVIKYVFRDDVLNAPLSDMDGNLTAWLGTGTGMVGACRDHVPDGIVNVHDLIRSAVNIPFLYGRSGQFIDPAFHKDYRRTLKTISKSGDPVLIITPWKSGISGKTHFVNPFLPANQKLVMARDILFLLGNIPNTTYGRDLKAVFG